MTVKTRGFPAGSGLAGMLVLTAALVWAGCASAKDGDYELNDSHFHLTNYIQEGTDIEDFLEIMGDKVGRVALFGIPLQQTWSYEVTGDYAPGYYLQTDAPLYYYSFTDAFIANAYLSLDKKDRRRFEPMITGFNPADMYGVDHIRRVLQTYPGVFTGIGEFTIHKEFVSSKVAGDVASLIDPALDRILAFAGEVGLVVIIHNDIDVPFGKEGEEPVYLTQMKAMLRRHPETSIIWAHTGLGRVVHPPRRSASPQATQRAENHFEYVLGIVRDPEFSHVNFDISWNEVAKYAVSSPESIQRTAAMLNTYPDRFLFGTDEVAPPDQETYLRVYRQYDPVWAQLTPDARAKVTRENFERLFDAAHDKVRAWEKANVK